MISGMKKSDSSRTTDDFVISPKLVMVATKAVTEKGKHFIYTSNLQSLRCLSWLLHHLYGFRDISEDVKNLAVTNASLERETQNRGITHRNFIVMETGDKLNIVQNFMSGIDTERKSERSALVPEDASIEKMKRNAHGQHCKIIIVTGELYTGVDINALRGVHLVEPFASISAQEQAEGRAARARGHDILNTANRSSVIYSYQSSVLKTSTFGWNAKMNSKKLGGQNVFVKKVSNSVTTKAITGAIMENITYGREWLDSEMRKQDSTITNGNAANRMNMNQILYPTPDEILNQERTKGAFSKTMQAFQTNFRAKVAQPPPQ